MKTALGYLVSRALFPQFSISHPIITLFMLCYWDPKLVSSIAIFCIGDAFSVDSTSYLDTRHAGISGH